jgi:hypothetical protein
MAKTYTAPMAQTINNSTAVLTTATGGITTDSPTNALLLFTAGAEGSIVTAIGALPRASITATALYLFSSEDSGTTLRLIDSVLIPAYTYATTTAVPQTVFTNYSEDYPLRLSANERLYVATSVTLASGIVVEARGVDY